MDFQNVTHFLQRYLKPDCQPKPSLVKQTVSFDLFEAYFHAISTFNMPQHFQLFSEILDMLRFQSEVRVCKHILGEVKKFFSGIPVN